MKTFASIVLGLSLLVTAMACGPTTGDLDRLNGSSPELNPVHGQAGTEGSSGASGAGPQSTGDGGIPCDVQATLEKKCWSCHGDTVQFGAPMPLTKAEHFLAAAVSNPSKKVHERVLDRVKADKSPMPPPPGEKLTPTELAAFESWFSKGSPPSSASCGTTPGSTKPQGRKINCTVDQKLRPAKKTEVPAKAGDQYMCYGVDISPGKKRHVVGLKPHVDNSAVLHHILLFQSSQAYSTTATPCASTQVSWALVAEWAPGADEFELPAEAGFPEEGTTHWVLQLHYSNPRALTGQLDESGYDLCTTDQLRKYDADVMATGSVSFTVPPRGTLDWRCNYPWGSGALGGGLTPFPDIHVFTVMPHMHQIGKSMSVHLLPKGGTTPELKMDQPAWNFESQVTFPANFDVKTGDTFQTRCVFQNNGSTPVKWGENTADEMCFAFLAYYPKVSAPLWSWAAPSAAVSTQCKAN